MKRRISPARVLVLLIIFALLLFVVSLLFIVGEWIFEAAWAFMSGWFSYPARVIPKISYNIEMILCGLGAFGMALFFSHRLLKWLAEYAPLIPSPWPFRFTAYLSFLLLSMFGTSIAMTGIIHQTAWLARSDSITSSRNMALVTVQKNNTKDLAGGLLMEAIDHPQHKYPASLAEFIIKNEEEILSDFLLCPLDKGGDAPWLYPAASKSLGGRFPVIISPRPNHQDLIIVAYSDGSVETHPFNELPSEVAFYFE